jgi:hypothetical protein
VPEHFSLHARCCRITRCQWMLVACLTHGFLTHRVHRVPFQRNTVHRPTSEFESCHASPPPSSRKKLTLAMFILAYLLLSLHLSSVPLKLSSPGDLGLSTTSTTLFSRRQHLCPPYFSCTDHSPFSLRPLFLSSDDDSPLGAPSSSATELLLTAGALSSRQQCSSQR